MNTESAKSSSPRIARKVVSSSSTTKAKTSSVSPPLKDSLKDLSSSHPEVISGTDKSDDRESESLMNVEALVQLLLKELQAELRAPSRTAHQVAQRIAQEVERICHKSDRIQNSGQMESWQIALARHRLQKCLAYYRLGSRQGRVELHSSLSAIVYRYIASSQAQLGFQARCTLIEDFLQGFYIESLKAFRRENQLPAEYSPHTQLELAEYMAFTEQYAKRRISLPGCRNQQLIVLRAQGYGNRQPPELAVDIELATESSRSEESEMHSRSMAIQQVRDQMVSESVDPAEGVLRDRVISELVQYLESQNQPDCIDYLTLKLQDLSAPEIDQILGLSARQRDYLQQRFKYHVEKFARTHNWQLVHEWLGADLDQNLGMSSQQWEMFLSQLTPEQRHLIQLKRLHQSDGQRVALTDQEIAKALNCTTKQVQKRWHKLLDLAWQVRNLPVEQRKSS